ncbi:hypothetical protein LCGC14_1414800 [marine sediment metagenome]|uniref:Uncharacterized protein n=1 Tax=marine sediment metagenome TaxID=412755 RepID=A0A0F9KE98_9ZZZZ
MAFMVVVIVLHGVVNYFIGGWWMNRVFSSLAVVVAFSGVLVRRE